MAPNFVTYLWRHEASFQQFSSQLGPLLGPMGKRLELEQFLLKHSIIESDLYIWTKILFKLRSRLKYVRENSVWRDFFQNPAARLLMIRFQWNENWKMKNNYLNQLW